MNHYLGLHKNKLALLLIVTVLSVAFFLLSFGFKDFTHRTWVDVIGEGGTAICLLTWILVFLWVRPAGRVTTTIYAGLSLVYFATLQDLLDEFFVTDSLKRLMTFAESVPSTVGMLVLTYGFLQWKGEEESFNFNRLKREKNLREAGAFDHITELYDAPYMEQRLQMLLDQQTTDKVSLILMDIGGYDAFYRRYGRPVANRLLKDVGAMIEMNIRDQDLVCRYASDRFVVLLPGADAAQVQQIGHDIHHVLQHCCYKVGDERQALDSVWISTTVSIHGKNLKVRTILRDANAQLSRKHKQIGSAAATVAMT